MGGVKAAEPSRFVMLILLQPVPSCRPHLRRRLINWGIIVLVCVHLLVTKPYVVDIVGEMNSSISTRAPSKQFCRSNISTEPYFPIPLSSVRRRAVVAQSNTQEAVLTDFQRREAETAARFVQKWIDARGRVPMHRVGLLLDFHGGCVLGCFLRRRKAYEAQRAKEISAEAQGVQW